jgi:D-alanyl-D-alanine carboxypeptidase
MKKPLLTLAIFHFVLAVYSQNNFIDSIKTHYKIVGMAYAVFNSNQILELGALGQRRINDTALVRTTDKFHIGSNTKAVTAFLAAKLVETKKIDWDTKYFDLFPELKSASKKEYWNITLQDLLSHRARINPYRSVNANSDTYKISGTSIEQKIKFAAIILKEPPAKPDSGQVYVYSNAGVSMAASMLEKVSGKPWEQLIDEYLNNQLKLDFEIGFPNVKDSSQPWGHILNSDTIMALPPDFDYHIATIMRPAGDLNVSIINYIKFIQLFLKGYNKQNNFLLSKTYKYILTALPAYTFGWANKTINGKNYNYHSGSAATFGCFTKIERDNDLAVIVMENYADGGALNAIQLIADFLLQKYSAAVGR